MQATVIRLVVVFMASTQSAQSRTNKLSNIDN